MKTTADRQDRLSGKTPVQPAPKGRGNAAKGASPWIGLLLAVVFSPGLASAQSSIDRVHRRNGVDSGKITATTPLGLTISKGGVESDVPVEEIESVTFASEPSEVSAARNALQAGRPQEALDALAKLAPNGVTREEILAEIEFLRALAKAQLALAGQGELAAAGAEMRTFMSQRNKSFHVPQAIETLGDLAIAEGQYAKARTEYAKLAKAKSPYFELKSALLVGRAWQAEGDHAQAAAEFEKVTSSAEKGPLAVPLQLAATLDQAVSQAATGNVTEATAAIGLMINQASPEDAALLARAYNALGDCYLQSGDRRGALFAFLHVDLLYNREAEAHAKALHELIPLWKQLGRESRSQEAAQTLAEKYPGSRWAKQ